MTVNDDDSPYQPIIDNLRDTTNSYIADVTRVARQASEKIDADTYTARDLILTMTEMARIAANSGAELTTRAMTDTPPGLKQVADYSRAIGRRLLQDARSVYIDATERIDKGTYDVDDAVVSLIRLADHAIVGGFEIAQTLVSGPAQFDTGILTIPLPVPVAKTDREHRLGSVRVRRFGDREDTEIAPERTSLATEAGSDGEQVLMLTLRTCELPSGVYHGTAEIDDARVEFEFAVDAG
jgi:hypothetical protein